MTVSAKNRSVSCVVWAIVWLAAAASAAAQTTAGGSSISGRTIDGVTGAPLSSVRVELLPQGRLTATGADGTWTFDDVQPGDYAVRMTAEGFEAATVAVAPGATATNRDVALRRRPYQVHESVIVTARREATPAFDVPRSTTVISTAELNRRLPRTTPEALWDAPGVFVQKTNHGSGSPFIRGLVGNQVLVLVDGIRLNNATFRYGPNQYLATIDPGLIDRIEVVRGSGSVLYGSDAMGGVINIVTRRPEDVGQAATVRARASGRVMSGGMEESGRFELALTGPRGGLLGGFSTRRFGDLRAGGRLGTESPSGYDEFSGDLRAEMPLSPSQRLTVAYQHHRQHDVPRFDQVAQRGFARYAFDPQVRQLGYARYEQSSANRWLRGVRATASLHHSTEQREYQRRSSETLTIERDEVLVAGGSVELQSQPHAAISMISGIDYYADDVQSGRRDTQSSTNQVVTRRGLYPDGATAASLAVFTHATVTHGRWQTDGGIRLARFRVSADDATFGSARIAPTTATGSASAMFTVAEGLRLFGSVSQAFRAPNIDDLSTLGPFDFGVEVPSPRLEPETSLTVEAGAKLRNSRGGASVAMYRTALHQLIDRVPGLLNGMPLVGDQAVYQKNNVGNAFIWGFEADGELALSSPLMLNGSITYTYGEVTSRGEPMRRIPPLNGLLALRLTPTSRVWMEAATRFATRQARLAAGDIADHRIPAGGTPGWATVGVNAGYRVSETLDLVGGVQNLFDEAYRTHGSGIDGPGRSAWIGVNAKLF